MQPDVDLGVKLLMAARLSMFADTACRHAGTGLSVPSGVGGQDGNPVETPSAWPWPGARGLG